MPITVSQMNRFSARVAEEKSTYWERLRSWLQFLYFTRGSYQHFMIIQKLDAAHNLSKAFENGRP